MPHIQPYLLYTTEGWRSTFQNVTERVVWMQKLTIRIINNYGSNTCLKSYNVMQVLNAIEAENAIKTLKLSKVLLKHSLLHYLKTPHSAHYGECI